MRRLALLPVLFLFAACDSPTGPSFPNLSGTFDADWGVQFTHVASGESFQESCPGTLSVTQQSGGNFSGSFTIRETTNCSASSGSLAGEVRSDGGLNFRIDVPGADDNAFENLTGCVVVSGSDQMNGTFTGGRITASASAFMDCPSEWGPQRWQMTLSVNALKR